MKNVISFGTDGIRGRVGLFPFTPDALRTLGAAIAHWSLDKYANPSPKVLVGYDSRVSGPEIKQDLINVFAYFGLDIVDAGVLTTPAIYRLISLDTSFDFGVVISASHNPYYDNGIKLFDAKKCKLDRVDECKIEELFGFYFKNQAKLDFVTDKTVAVWSSAGKVYQDYIYSCFAPGFLSGLKIVLDCANGASSYIAPEIFERFGATIVKIGSEPSGRNINDKCGSLHPDLIIKTVMQAGADIGFAFDGDADRLQIVTNTGLLKDGDDALMLLLSHPDYCGVGVVVATITTNQGLESELKKKGRHLIRTQVGDKYVAAALEESNLPIGAETSGHVIIKDYMITGDGIFVALKIMESVIFNKNWDLKTFDKYPQVSINIPVKNKRDLSVEPYSLIIEKCRQSIKDGRIVVRYSGTENLLRIMTEASTDPVARSVAAELAKSLQTALSE